MKENVFMKRHSIFKRADISILEVIIISLITVVAIFLRLMFFNNVTDDYTRFLSVWYDTLKQSGGINGIGVSIGDYTPMYIYLMALMTYIPIKSLYSIKLVSCLFDIILAFTALYAVYKKTGNMLLSSCCYGIILFAPTVWLNSAAWSQCDVIYTLFCLLCVICIACERPLLSAIFFGIAFSFKLQAIFIAPFLLLMLLLKKIKIRHFFAIPLVYIVSILPAFFAGRSFTELITIYFHQSGQYKRLTLNAPSIYTFFGMNVENDTAAFYGILLCGAAVIFSIIVVWCMRPGFESADIFAAALYFSILIPMLLPHMHERYFYVADILSIVYAFMRPKRFFIPIIVVLSSLVSYLRYLQGNTIVDMRIVTLLMLSALFIVGYDLFTQSYKKACFNQKIGLKIGRNK